MTASERTNQPVDRTGWPSGPWDGEPDRVDFVHAGFACFVKRGPMGAWCGYVGVPETHPAFGKPYDDVNVDVHGGLTYADRCSGELCHVPQPGTPDNVWWLGFDCAHCHDITPATMKYRSQFPASYEEAYRDLSYVRAETERLADQLAESNVEFAA